MKKWKIGLVYGVLSGLLAKHMSSSARGVESVTTGNSSMIADIYFFLIPGFILMLVCSYMLVKEKSSENHDITLKERFISILGCVIVGIIIGSIFGYIRVNILDTELAKAVAQVGKQSGSVKMSMIGRMLEIRIDAIKDFYRFACGAIGLLIGVFYLQQDSRRNAKAKW